MREPCGPQSIGYTAVAATDSVQLPIAVGVRVLSRHVRIAVFNKSDVRIPAGNTEPHLLVDFLRSGPQCADAEQRSHCESYLEPAG